MLGGCSWLLEVFWWGGRTPESNRRQPRRSPQHCSGREPQYIEVALVLGQSPQWIDDPCGGGGEVWPITATWFGAASRYLVDGDAGPLLQVIEKRKEGRGVMSDE